MYNNKKKILEIENIYFDASVKFNISLGKKGNVKHPQWIKKLPEGKKPNQPSKPPNRPEEM